MPLGSLKKRVKSKKAFHFSSKKRSADVTCNGSAQKHRTAAVGRVLRVQGSPFQDRCLLAALKRGSSQKKLFISVKRTEARAIHAMARAVYEHEMDAAGRVLERARDMQWLEV